MNGITANSGRDIDRQMASNFASSDTLKNLPAGVHRSEADRIRRAARTMHMLPLVVKRYEDLALSHDLAAARKEDEATRAAVLTAAAT